MSDRSEAGQADYRSRILAGMAAGIAEVAYPSLTIAEIVRRARVSKRTFYEQFAGKEECLLALYEAESDVLIERIELALAAAPEGEARLQAGVAAYLSGLQANPGMVRTLLIEILAAGPRGLEVRRRVNRRFAQLLLRQLPVWDPGKALAMALMTAVVGGINELVLEAVEEDRADRLTELAGPIAALVRSAFQARPVEGAIG